MDSRFGHTPNPTPRCHRPSRCFTVDIVRCQFGKHRPTLICTATLLFQPQLITTMYKQLHTIKHINHQFVVLHTCTQTLHTWHSEMHKKSLEAPITTKDNSLLYWTFSDKKCALQTPAFLTIVSVQSTRFISFNHCWHRFFVWQWQQVWLKISNWSLYNIDSGTQHHNKMIF